MSLCCSKATTFPWRHCCPHLVQQVQLLQGHPQIHFQIRQLWLVPLLLVLMDQRVSGQTLTACLRRHITLCCQYCGSAVGSERGQSSTAILLFLLLRLQRAHRQSRPQLKQKRLLGQFV